MASLLNFDRVQHQRDIDLVVKAAAIRQMADKPKRQAFAMHHPQTGISLEAASKPSDALQGVAQQAQTGKAAARKVVVCLPEQPGGLRAVSVDGSVVGHAQKVPDEIRRPWGVSLCDEWAFKAVTADNLEYFESLAEIRAYVIEDKAVACRA